MKKIRYLITCFIAIFVLTGCNGVDNEPMNSYTNKSFWTSVDKAQHTLNMTYSQLHSAGEIWQDEASSDSMSQGCGSIDQRAIRSGIAGPATPISINERSSLYGSIKTTRVILESINDLDATGAMKNDMKAQVRFIRTSLFFRLTNFYGDIPFFTRDITLGETNTINRTPRTRVIGLIRQELDDIMQYLSTRGRLFMEENGKITQAAALTPQVRVYLYGNDWTNVEKYTGQITGGNHGTYKLFPSFSGLFESENEYSSEVIMDYAYIPSARIRGKVNDMAPLSKDIRVISMAPTQELVDSFITLDGDPISSPKTYNEVRPYIDRDPRLTGTVIYDGYNQSRNIKDGSAGRAIYTNPKKNTPDGYKGLTGNSSATGYYVRKYHGKHHEAGMVSGLNVITIRYADVLSMYAEAMNEQGRMTAEVWNRTIRSIRECVGFTRPKAFNLPTEQSQTKIHQTLRIGHRPELTLEGLGWFDIKRRKTGTEYLSGYMHGAKYGTNNTYVRLGNYQLLDARDYLWSAPQSQMDVNPNLKPNNPRYANQ